jgi:ribosomal protein S18 acetylase RimI-like enzyme
LDFRPRLDHDDRPSEDQREADLRQRPVRAADGDDAVARRCDGEVPRVPDPRDDDVVDPLVRLAARAPGEDPDRRAAGRLRSPRRGGHDLAEAAADHGDAALGEQAPDLLGSGLVLRPAADHRNLRSHASDATKHPFGAHRIQGRPISNVVRYFLNERLVPAVALVGTGAVIPGGLIHYYGDDQVHFGAGQHFYGVGVSALAAALAAIALSVGGIKRGDGRVVLVGTGFTVMAALLAIHGLATPSVIIGMNGVIAFTGGATLPVGGAVLALSALPSLRRPTGIRALVVLQIVSVAAILTLGVVGMTFPSAVPSMPQPGSPSAVAALVAGMAFYALLILRSLKTYLLTHRAGDLFVVIGIAWLTAALPPAMPFRSWISAGGWVTASSSWASSARPSQPTSTAPRSRDRSSATCARRSSSRRRRPSSARAFALSHACSRRRTSRPRSTRGAWRCSRFRSARSWGSHGRLRALAIGGLLHDIGKLSVPEAILKKPGALDDDEFAIIRKHPEWGYKLLRELGGFSDSIRELVRSHHERLDGKGYPRGQQARQLDLDARILTVCASTTRSSRRASTATRGRTTPRSASSVRRAAPRSTPRASRHSRGCSRTRRPCSRGSRPRTPDTPVRHCGDGSWPAMILSVDDLATCIAFTRAFDDRIVGRREPARFGVALFDDELPLVFDRNLLLVDLGALPTVDELITETERLQHGLRHRKIRVDDDHGARLQPAFLQRGWRVTRLVVMAHRGEPPSDAPVQTSETTADTLAPIWAAGIRSEPFGSDEEVVRQLVAAQRRRADAVAVRYFASRSESGAIAAYCELFSDGRTAQIESVMTLPAFRQRGHGRAVVHRALVEAIAMGHGLVFLLADDEDWPKTLYAKLGFEPLGLVWDFVREPR